MIPDKEKEILRKALRYDPESVVDFIDLLDWDGVDIRLAFSLIFKL